MTSPYSLWPPRGRKDGRWTRHKAREGTAPTSTRPPSFCPVVPTPLPPSKPHPPPSPAQSFSWAALSSEMPWAASSRQHGYPVVGIWVVMAREVVRAELCLVMDFHSRDGCLTRPWCWTSRMAKIRRRSQATRSSFRTLRETGEISARQAAGRVPSAGRRSPALGSQPCSARQQLQEAQGTGAGKWARTWLLLGFQPCPHHVLQEAQGFLQELGSDS